MNAKNYGGNLGEIQALRGQLEIVRRQLAVNEALKIFPAKQPPTQADRQIRIDQAKNKICREERIGPPYHKDDCECPNHADVEGQDNRGAFEGK